ncbi:DGQHR domain-containing protein DpdB [Caulobacter sp. SL161]|uniref:DGQHR domain-containing protein DpdB n=1 Tax=Caulobacter sp. SL161 TaxID=2995156 RepID=UPI0022756D69|nr:DGQHR domain-containing protein DpdB [Caulobacter sp. SL161]MCY1646672.1 DGQHR domain-containing protein DpdB [Caulobacter sp. SL161]
MNRSATLSVRALRTRQAAGLDVFAFFVRGDEVMKIADISRLHRDENQLRGFQRKEIKSHVSEIAEFLKKGEVLFPNAIILALSKEVAFKLSRGPAPQGGTDAVQSGVLCIPLRPEGQRAAWIVDGQQRSLALSKANQSDLLVPIVAFVSSDLEVQREQFILVNKAKPLPSRLIDELLPEVSVDLPRDLAPRLVPSVLCNALNQDPDSPFYKLIKRESEAGVSGPVITDTPLMSALQGNLRPGGALGSYRTSAGTDLQSMLTALNIYWGAVKSTFPDAWGRPAQESRLSHSVGVRVMGALMDPIWTRADASLDPKADVASSLARLAPYCRWTSGVWEELGWAWDDPQSLPKHIKGLTDYLLRLDRDLSRASR